MKFVTHFIFITTTETCYRIQSSMRLQQLPTHPIRKYIPVHVCIYCGEKENLSDEHIIPFALGGNWLLPKSSCRECSQLTSEFERTCLRIILGPTRLHLNFPTRRKKTRPSKLSLKMKYNKEDKDWVDIDVQQEDYPFIIGLPQYGLPDEISGLITVDHRDSGTKSIWVRGGNLHNNTNAYLEFICRKYRMAAVMPTMNLKTHEFCLMLTKIAHAYTIAEVGINSFKPFLSTMICRADTSNSIQYVGGLLAAEPRSKNLHEVSFDSSLNTNPNIISVRIRLLAFLEAPTYYVAVGRKHENP